MIIARSSITHDQFEPHQHSSQLVQATAQLIKNTMDKKGVHAVKSAVTKPVVVVTATT